MSSTTPGYSNPFEPSRFRFQSVGIGLTPESFESLALEGNQYLLVGEEVHGTTPVYSLLVDSAGLAVKSSLQDWDRVSGNHALYIDGNIYVTGNILSQDGQLLNGLPNPAASSNLTYWRNSVPTDPDRIFHNGSVTVGSRTTSTINQYGFTVARPSNYRLTEIQLALQNQKNATTHMGFVGNASNSPFIVASSSNTPIEFHTGRGANYFERMYRPGDTSRDIPSYSNPDDAPMLCMDANGSVVVGWYEAPRFVYEKRVIEANSKLVYQPVVERAKMHVSGLLFASNITMYDPDTNRIQSLDSLFVRREGATILANRVFPGAFARGNYVFPDVLGVGDLLYTSNLTASNAYIDQLRTREMLATGLSRFQNSVQADTDVLVRRNIYLQGGLFVESTDNNGSNIWSPIEFTSSNLNASSSNIISYQDGFYTTGRVGIGVNEARGLGINEQAVIVRPNQTVMGLELRDESSTVRVYQGYMGHVDWRDNFLDGSMIFMTAPRQQVGQDSYFQHMYFLPGKHKNYTNDYQQSEVAPAMALLDTDQAVVGGFTAASSNARLTVRGNTYIDGEIYLKNEGSNTTYFSLAKWREVTVFNESNQGLQYKNPNVTAVGIHTEPNMDYSLNVAGKVYLPDGLYDYTQNETSQWYNTTTGSVAYLPSEGEIRKMFTQSRVGVGVVDPQVTLDVKSWDVSVPTQFSLNQVSGELSSSILFRGTDATVNTPNFEITAAPISGASPSPVLIMRHSSSPAGSNAGIHMIWDAQLQKHRIGINETPRVHGSNLFPGSTDASMTIGGGLNVVGNVNVTGSYLMSGTLVVNSNMGFSNAYKNPAASNSENVYIYGNQIQVNPTETFTVGYTQSLYDADNTGAIFRVYHPTPIGGVVARFVSQSPSVLLELASQSTGRRFRFGLDTDENFMIQSPEAGAPYFYVKKGEASSNHTDGLQRTARGIGYGTSAPEAAVHMVSDVAKEPLLRVTRSLATDMPGVEPFVDLERRVHSSSNSYMWRLRGPDSTHEDRLTLEYINVASNGYTESSRNAWAVTRKGDLGLGVDAPEARLHVATTGLDASTPLLKLVTESNQSHIQFVASNQPTIYQISTESNGNWYLHSLGTDQIENQRRNLMEFSSNGNLGLRETPNDAYTFNLRSNMNINLGGIFIDGVSVLQGSNLGRLYDQRLYHKHFYLLPDPEVGTITFNRPDYTSNWFHVRGRNDDPTLQVLESTTPNCWAYLQATGQNEYHMYRTGISNLNHVVQEYLPESATFHVGPSSSSNLLRMSKVSWLGSNSLDRFAHYSYGTVYVQNPVGASNKLHLGLDTDTALVGLGPTLEITAPQGTGFGIKPQAIVHIGDQFADSNLPNLKINQSQNSDALVIEDKFGSNIFTVNTKVGVRVADPQHDLHVNGTTFIQNDTYLASDLYIAGDAHNTSDQRLKTNLVQITEPLEKIQKLTGYTYDRIDLGGKRSAGLLAQDVQAVMPEVVQEATNGYLSIGYGNMMSLMVEAIKALTAEVADLKEKVRILTNNAPSF